MVVSLRSAVVCLLVIAWFGISFGQIDRITGKRTEGVTTGQIYWGAVPFVVIQVIMVVLVIMFPAMVMHYKSTATGIDPDKVKIEIPQIDLPPLDLNIK